MNPNFRPHLLGIDDGPFTKGAGAGVRVVAVMTEGPDLVEGVAVSEFPEDGEQAAEFLEGWVSHLRFREALHGVVLGGITIAGLGVVDTPLLSRALRLPVLVINRREPQDQPLIGALQSAGLERRIEIVRRTPRAFPVGHGLYTAAAGTDRETATRLVQATTGKSRIPEPLRLAHLFASAIVRGQSHGRP